MECKEPVVVEVDAVSRVAWRLASGFPPDKEAVYPEHGVVQEFDSHRGKRILDYGCGGGPDTMSFLKRGNQVWFADIVPENVATATQRIREAGVNVGEIHAIAGPLAGMRKPGRDEGLSPGTGITHTPCAWPVALEVSAPLPFPDVVFDVVSSHGCLHHIRNVEPVVAEFFRILKPGGLIYVMLYTEILWDRCLPEMTSRVQAGAMPDLFAAFCSMTDYGAPYARKYTVEEGCDLLEHAGFEVLKSTVWNNGDFRTFKAKKP